jgi:hypothetical protein
MPDKIYTHDEASRIVELFENVLVKHNICVPSPEDDERDPDDMVGLYGSTYSELLDYVENKLLEITEAVRNGAEVIPEEYSGNF